MMSKRKAQERSVELFSTDSGIKAVDSQVRKDILTLLLEKERNFDSIVTHTGKAKSTISVHLKSLTTEGIIDSRADPEDARRKIFFIRSNHLGGLLRGKKVEEDVEEYFSTYAFSSADPFAFLKLIFRTFRVSLLNEGFEIDPVLHEAGASVGRALYREVKDPDIEGVLEKLARFWKEQNLGRVEVESVEPLALRVYDCYECQDLPPLGRPACALDAGILQTVFSNHFEAKMKAIETHCYAMGDDYCRFVVRKVA